MAALRNDNRARRPTVELDRAHGLVRIHDARVFGPGAEAHCERFLRRVLTVEGVGSVGVDRRAGVAEIVVEAGALDGVTPQIVRALCGKGAVLTAGALPAAATGSRFRIHRSHGRLTTWEVVREARGQLRLRNDRPCGDRVAARRVERALSATPGVTGARFGRWSGILKIDYLPGVVEPGTLIGLAEAALVDAPLLLPAPRPVRFAMANANLGVAALADLALPALAPVSAVLLVGTNLGTFREAGRQLVRKELGLPVLYTAIVGGTLATGQFLASAVMMWMFRYWKRRQQLEVVTEQQLLIEECPAPPALARLISSEQTETVVAGTQLRPGDRLVVRSGEPIPADGRVLAGDGVVDERGVCGLEGASRKRPGDEVLCGTTLLLGQLQVAVGRPGEATRAAAIRRALLAATGDRATPPRPSPRTDLAGRAVAPTLATAGIGLVVGDLTTAVAILRPDYATGPSLAEALSAIGDVADCFDRGVLVRDCAALDRLAEVDTLVIVDYPELRRPELRLVNIESQTPEIDRLIRLGGSLGRYIADERGAALQAACRARDLTLLNLGPVDLSRGISARYGRRHIRLRDADDAFDDPGEGGPLALEVDGQRAGTFHFRPTTELAAARAIRTLRTGRQLRVALLSRQRPVEAAALARALGADEWRTEPTEAALAGYLQQCHHEGRRAAVVGEGRILDGVLASSTVTIALVGDGDLEASGASILLLQNSLERLMDLWGIAQARSTRSREARHLTLVPNVFCIAGAFFLGFTSLTAVLISNLATLGNAVKASEDLRRAGGTGRTRRRPALGAPVQQPAPRGVPTQEHSKEPAERGGSDASTDRASPVPPELGALLIAVGCLGVILPGVIGGPAILAGGLALWPRAFRPIDAWFEHRFPVIHGKSLQQIGRFVDDLSRRYPSATGLPGGWRE
jgi:cation transport ATPase